MTSKAASEDVLGELHFLVASDFVSLMKGEVIEELAETNKETGEVRIVERKVRRTAADVANILTLLKQSNITCAANKGSAVSKLKEIMEQRRKANDPIITDMHAEFNPHEA